MPLACQRRLAALAPLLLLAGCFRLIPPGAGPAAPAPTSALAAGVALGPDVSTLALTPNDAAEALAAFRASCPRLLAREDASALTRPADWQDPCQAATRWPQAEAARFFQTWFETVRVGDGKAFVTGYYEPEIAGVRTPRPGYGVPVYAVPSDLVRAAPADAPPGPDGQQPLGRYDADHHFAAYYTRAEIEDGALAGRGLEIGWAADPVELFFLQVQGSGRLVAPDGSVMRIGYAGQNGQAYTGIGKLMRDRGLVGEGTAYATSMQGLMQYLHDHPEEGRALMRENLSYVFFRELTGEGPIGALGVPVRGHTSLAVDPAFVPLGAPVLLDLDRSEAGGLWIAQDTGGAIKGANRFDSFWGAGAEARLTAGGMSAHGSALVLVPRGTLARLKAR